MLIKVKSISISGLKTIGIDVEVNVANRGLPSFDIVGLASKAVAESKERVKAAIVNSGIEFPVKKITINLAPADVPKQGSCYDLPVAMGILSLVNDLALPDNALFFGELSLDGSLRHTKGALLVALFAKSNNVKNVFVPAPSANEAAIVSGVNVFPVLNLNQLLLHCAGKKSIRPVKYKLFPDQLVNPDFDLSEIFGQEQAKRALEISASGGHNFFMVGSPGAGKTMLARSLPGILPLLTEKESLEVTQIYSVSGLIPATGSLIRARPFRSPHHTVSQVGITGGGSNPLPGEVSLSHRGVLFLDEFNEFPRLVIESLRQPMEDGMLTISRSRERITYPCRFILIASANPCPCGYLQHPKKECSCTAREINKYHKRVSGPILDRIDLHVDVPVVNIEDLSSGHNDKGGKLDNSEKIRNRVVKARNIQKERFQNDNIHINAEMSNSQIKKHCKLSNELKQLLLKAARKHHFSGRTYFKMIKIARTIADLDGSPDINIHHLAEALQYRPKVRSVP